MLFLTKKRQVLWGTNDIFGIHLKSNEEYCSNTIEEKEFIICYDAITLEVSFHISLPQLDFVA